MKNAKKAMKLKDIYALAIQMGIANDPRGAEAVKKQLAREKKRYDKLSDKDKADFDAERLNNPYLDSRMLFGDPEKEIKKVMVGVDIDSAELLLADRLNEKGEGIDLVIAHHPLGAGLASLADVMNLQIGYLASVGVLPNIAEALMGERIGVVSRSVSSSNHFRAVDSARLLGLPLMCIHTPADNMVTAFLQKKISEKQLETLGEFVELLKEIPEYRESGKNNAPARILSGKEDGSLGKVYIDFTGGTSGAEGNYEQLAKAGISTVVAMHMGEKHLELAKKCYLNVVLAGHISSDSLGLNIFLDELEKNGVETVPVSGLIRIKRS